MQTTFFKYFGIFLMFRTESRHIKFNRQLSNINISKFLKSLACDSDDSFKPLEYIYI